MKRTKDAKVSITKPLLAGLNVVKSSNTNEAGEAKKPAPSFGKTSSNRPDSYQDSGGGYNADLSSIQE